MTLHTGWHDPGQPPTVYLCGRRAPEGVKPNWLTKTKAPSCKTCGRIVKENGWRVGKEGDPSLDRRLWLASINEATKDGAR